MMFRDMNSRGQVDLIDMQSQADGEFKWILVYQDHLTKIVQLRATKSKRAAEVAYHLLDIFCIFGAPAILQSDNRREFANHIITELSGITFCSGQEKQHTPSWFKVLTLRSYVRSVYEDWFENFKHTNRDPSWFDQ